MHIIAKTGSGMDVSVAETEHVFSLCMEEADHHMRLSTTPPPANHSVFFFVCKRNNF